VLCIRGDGWLHSLFRRAHPRRCETLVTETVAKPTVGLQSSCEKSRAAEQSHAVQPEQMKTDTLPSSLRGIEGTTNSSRRLLGAGEKRVTPGQVGGMEGGESAGGTLAMWRHPHCYCQTSRLADRDNPSKGLRQWPEGLVGREIFGVSFLAVLSGITEPCRFPTYLWRGSTRPCPGSPGYVAAMAGGVGPAGG
jgi:hypothetical protein